MSVIYNKNPFNNSFEDILCNDYQICQRIEKIMHSRDKKLFFSIVNNYKNISKKMGQTLKTYNDMKQYISNSFDYEYSTGIVEGINNLIKQVKHVTCGYKQFNHLKARVILIKGLLNSIIA